MADPFEQLGVGADADDAAIRAAYLNLVRRYPPEQSPERFAAIRAAYELIRDSDARLRWLMFEAARHETLDAWIEDLACRTPRRRPSLQELLTAQRAR